MGWDYQTYMSQPLWLLDLLDSKLEAETEHHKLGPPENDE